MATFKLKKGLNIPLSGMPNDTLQKAATVERVAFLGRDYVGLKPRLLVAEGDRVKRGQPLLADKTHPEIVFPSPGGGTVEAIVRGERRVLLAIVIRLDAQEEVVTGQGMSEDRMATLKREEVLERLFQFGAWPSLRRRPFAKIPSPQEQPSALFVTATDTQPLAPSIPQIMAQRGAYLEAGLTVMRQLFDGPIHFCSGPSWKHPLPALSNFHHAIFGGPHPAGNVGTHIHFVHPADKNRPVWSLDLQDLLAIGQLFKDGLWPVERVISLAGPGVKEPSHLITRHGAELQGLLADRLLPGPWRQISGSVLAGRTAEGAEAFLGRYHQQVTVIAEDLKRRFLGWVNPFPGKLFSMKRVVLGAWLPKRRRAMTTSRNGGLRALVPTGSFERVMPLKLMPTFLLRALLAKDVEEAEALGCLELAEEDLALCTFVCPSKIEYGTHLREMLDLIEKEG